jgi:tetratricopeptide (TPR) repeat protein
MSKWSTDRFVTLAGLAVAVIAVIYTIRDHRALDYQRSLVLDQAIESVSRGMPTLAQTRWLPSGHELAVITKAMADLDAILRGGESGKAYNAKGVLHERLGQYDNALAAFERARRFYAGNPAWLALITNNIGDSWEERCEYRTAEARYRESLALHRTPLALANLAECLFRQHRFEEALRLAKEAIGGDRMSVGAHFVYAKLLWQSGDRKNAIEEFQRAIQIDPQYQPDTHLELSRALAMTDDPDGALDEASAAIDIAPTFAEAHEWYAGLLEKKGDAGSARYERQKAGRLMSLQKPGSC